MRIEFSKYQGTGNDFVLLNNLEGNYDFLDIPHVQFICDRRFGVGADGLIRINSKSGFDFEVDYFNSDGSKSFCGNGARCAVAFAETLGIAVKETLFMAIDGAHKAWKRSDIVSLEMKNVDFLGKQNEDLVIHTGSPHYIHFEHVGDRKDIVEFGKSIRYSEPYEKEGINVNLVHCRSSNTIEVQTYERGVENETLSCGTGVTACAIATAYNYNLVGFIQINVLVKGGELHVEFNRKGEQNFEQIRLSGPAVHVFNGNIDV
jgi:diaminopimelate epimerase